MMVWNCLLHWVKMLMGLVEVAYTSKVGKHHRRCTVETGA
jgi:hypothetical protein